MCVCKKYPVSNATSIDITDKMEGSIHQVISYLRGLAEAYPDANLHHEVHDDAYNEQYTGTHYQVRIQIVYRETP